MVKIYWNLNKRVYSWMFGLTVAIAILIIALKITADGIGLNMVDPVVNERIFDSMIPVFLYGLVVGVLGLASTGIHIYIMIKPFMGKQLQQVLLLGKTIEPYIFVHYIFAVLVGLAGSISTLVLFVELDTPSILKLVISSFAYPAWITAIFLLLYNDNCLPQMLKKRKNFLIVAGVLGMWFVITMFQVFPAMWWGMQLGFTVAATEGTEVVTQTMPETIKGISEGFYGIQLVDVIGILIFILSFRWMKGKYTIKM